MKILKAVTWFSALLSLSLAGCSGEGPVKPAAETDKEMQKSMEDMTKMLPKNPSAAPAAGGGAADGK